MKLELQKGVLNSDLFEKSVIAVRTNQRIEIREVTYPQNQLQIAQK